MMKRSIFFLCAALLLSGSAGALAVYAQDGCEVQQLLWDNLTFNKDGLQMGHVGAEEGVFHTVSDKMGAVQAAPYPAVLSAKHQEAIMQSREAYLRGDYRTAYQVLEAPYADEPLNPFILNEYARALYWVDAQVDRSMKVYRELVRLLDEEAAARLGSEVVYVDAWFGEAYWKLGTLYLDSGAHSLAIQEISRALVANAGQAHPAFLKQAFSFLSEAYTAVGQHEEAACFSDLAMNLDR